MTVGRMATLLGVIVRPLAQVAGWVVWVFLAYTLEAVRLTAQLPRASVRVQIQTWIVWAHQTLLGGLTW
jgi:hypothetical protein